MRISRRMPSAHVTVAALSCCHILIQDHTVSSSLGRPIRVTSIATDAFVLVAKVRVRRRTRRRGEFLKCAQMFFAYLFACLYCEGSRSIHPPLCGDIVDGSELAIWRCRNRESRFYSLRRTSLSRFLDRTWGATWDQSEKLLKISARVANTASGPIVEVETDGRKQSIAIAPKTVGHLRSAP